MHELIDCHIHSSLCGHAEASVQQMVSAAVFAGLSGVVFTEHLPLPDILDPHRHLSMAEDALESYVAQVAEMAGRVRGLDLVVGAEADWIPEHEEYAAAQRARARGLGVQVLLGSVHFLGDWAFDDPHHLEEWERHDVDAAYERYFALWCDAARSGAFDVMAHPDLIKKFGHRYSGDPAALYRGAAQAAADGGVLVEVSTAGLRKPVHELYPAAQLLAQFKEAGVDATVGSDAHSTAEVGDRLADAYAALTAAGYERVAFPQGEGRVRWIEL